MWICEVTFERAYGCQGDLMEVAWGSLEEWQGSILGLLGGQEQVMWGLLLKGLGLEPKGVRQAVEAHLDRECDMGGYFAWPSFLRSLVDRKGQRDEDDSNKRRKSNSGIAFFKPLQLQEENEWLPLFGYMIAYAFLCQNSNASFTQGSTIHEIMDHLQSIIPSLPATLGVSPVQRKIFLCGVTACLIDGLGIGLASAVLSLRDEEDEGLEGQSQGGCSLLGAEVAQIVELLCLPGLIPTLAKNVNCHLASLVSNTAETLLDYSDANHRLHHQIPIGAPEAEDDAIIHQLMAHDAVHIMQFINKTNPQLKRELSNKQFTMQTHNFKEDDPRKHPIITYLRAILVSGNLDEGSKLCRALEECSGLDEETERTCWYSLFDKMQEENVLFEHDWNRNRSGFTIVPIIDHHGNMSERKIGNVTLANIMIGPLGRMVALEYLTAIIYEAKEELFPGYSTLIATNSIRTKCTADHEKAYLLAIKDAVRRTVIKFLIPRPHSPAEVLMLATRASEADKPPMLKYHAGSSRGEDAGELCCKILQESSLLAEWEENERIHQEDEEERLALAETAVQPNAMRHEEVAEDDSGGLMDMSMELIPPTPAKTPLKLTAATAAKTPQMPAPPEEHEEIVLGDSNDEEVMPEKEPLLEAGEVYHEDLDAEAKVLETYVDQAEEKLEEDAQQEEEHDDSATKSLGSSHDEEIQRETQDSYYDSNEEYAEEEVSQYPSHYQHIPGNYSESDDYDEEDEEEAARREAFEGEYDDEEGRGSSRSDGSVEVVDIISSDGEQEEEEEERDIPGTEGARGTESAEEEAGETAALNAVVDDYIDAVTEQQLQQVEEAEQTAIDDAKALHDHVKEYIPVSSPLKKSPQKMRVSYTFTGEGQPVTGTMDAKTVVQGKVEAEIPSDAVTDHPPAVPLIENALNSAAKKELSSDMQPDSLVAPTNANSPVVNLSISVDAIHADSNEGGPDTNNVVVQKEGTDEAVDAKPTEDSAGMNMVEAIKIDTKLTEDEAEKSDAPYSSDGGNLGGELSEDMNADDEHESLDTEDDKRSLAEQGETFDEEEGAGDPASPAHSHDENAGDDDELMEIDQPSILVAAAMSSQQQGATFQDVMAKSYRRASIRSFDNTDEALAATDANLSEYDESSNGANILVESNVQVLAQSHGQDLALTSVLDEHIDVIDSDVEGQEGGQLTDDGYQPDAEVTEEEKIERKKTRTIDDGYVPDAEATEEENTKPIDRAGPKAVKKRDVRFEAVLETRGAPPMPTLPVEPAANQSIDDGYLPDGALTEEEKKDREERRSRNVEEGYMPDGHTTATDDDTAEKKDRRASYRKVPPPAEVEDPIDPGYLPSAVEGTEEERSDQESQDAGTIASVLVATALVTQKGVSEVGCIAKKASLATARIAKHKPESLSTQSIDDGYLPDGFTEEERGAPRGRERRRHDVEEGYMPDGHTTPGEATEEDQPDNTVNKPQLLRDVGMKLSRSGPSENVADQDIPADSSIDLATVASGYLPSAVEEERSEEEDTLTDIKDGSNAHTDAVHDIEEESLAIESIAMASSAEVTEKQSKSDNDTTVMVESKVSNDSMKAAELETEPPVSFKAKLATTGIQCTEKSELSIIPKSHIKTEDTKKKATIEAGTTEDHPDAMIDPRLSPITANPLKLIRDSSKANTSSPGKAKGIDLAGEDIRKKDPREELTVQSKSVRKSNRKTNSGEDSDQEHLDDVSAQSRTSSTRRSSRLKGKKVTSSPKVPLSITTGRRGNTAPTLPAVPEDKNLETPIAKSENVEEGEIVNAPTVASNTRSKDKQSTKDDDDASSVASSVGDDGASIASRTRRRGKRAADDEEASHASDKECSSRASTQGKRGNKTRQDVKPVELGRRKRKPDADDRASESVPSPPPKISRGRAKKAAPIDVNTNDIATESAPTPPPKTRRGRAKKAEPIDDGTNDNTTESVPTPPPKTRQGRTKKNEATNDEAKDDVSESVSSPPTKARKGRARKKNEPAEDEVNDDVSEHVSSPPKPRAGRKKKPDQENESNPSPVGKGRRTRKTATPSEGSESIASSRPRRNTRASKK